MKQKKFTLTKFQGITLFTVAMLIMAAVIVFYRNPLADPKEEMVKSAISILKGDNKVEDGDLLGFIGGSFAEELGASYMEFKYV